jgi:subtilase family serine protease
LSERFNRSRMARSALVASAALALTVGTAASAASAQAASHNVRRACAVTHAAGVASCMALIRTDVKQKIESLFQGKAPVGFGYGPSDLITAYNLPSSTAVRNVAVVDAFNDPNAVSDLATYQSSWGEPACNTSTGAGCLTVTNQNGASSPLPANSGTSGWATEESLDVDMVSAICPTCHIFLVEANQPSIADLGTGVKSAVSVLNAVAVSNSYGGSESSSETTWDTKWFKHSGVAITASAGDSGYGVSYPAASEWVTAVGGTTMPSVNPRTETVWSGTGSGCSKFEAKPSFQHHKGCSHRIDNDVAAVADPNTGVAIYDTYDQGGWLEVGGTSVSSPIIASVYALAGVPSAGSFPNSFPYAHTGNLNDITLGSNGSCSKHPFLCTAKSGYDGPTGFGTPNGDAAFAG